MIRADQAFARNGYDAKFDGAFPDDNALANSACDNNDDPVDTPELEAWGFNEITIAEIELRALTDGFALPLDY